MEQLDKEIFSSRLKLARKMAGMSLQALSDKLNGIVSKQSLDKYELGKMLPSDEMLFHISNALNLKPDYFFRKNPVELESVCFRKKANLSKFAEESIIGKSKDYVERYSEIENIIGINNSFNNPISEMVIENTTDVEKAAIRLREYWELGTDAISNIRQLLELRGVKVYTLDHDDSFDGASFLTGNNQPVVVVNSKDKSIDRVRFTIMHELAHLLLNITSELADNSKFIEDLCHKFASCFLLPSKKLIELIGGKKRSYININELISIKEGYGISLRAIVFRLKEMEIISEVYYQKWVVYLSKTYGSKDEPGRYSQSENISVFEQLVSRALAEGIISISKASYLLNVDINDLRKGKANV
ncbi:MAG: XRE family transcriptional regulator [Bacteroidales bacterium]|nr:XRE family transcriptional regulator [Bacteroidales bacterium]MDD3859300.1 XRE family transcriptional regulator [Bacteroidales bacterium]